MSEMGTTYCCDCAQEVDTLRRERDEAVELLRELYRGYEPETEDGSVYKYKYEFDGKWLDRVVAILGGEGE
jgi:hypothetical protein